MNSLNTNRIVVTSQEELNNLDSSDKVVINFGTMETPAILNRNFDTIDVINTSVVSVVDGCVVSFYDRSRSIGSPKKSILTAYDDATISVKNDGKNNIFAYGGTVYVSGDNAVVGLGMSKINVINERGIVFSNYPVLSLYETSTADLYGSVKLYMYGNTLANVCFDGCIFADMYDYSTILMSCKNKESFNNINKLSDNAHVVLLSDSDIKKDLIGNGYEMYDNNNRIYLYMPYFLREKSIDIEDLKRKFCGHNRHPIGSMYPTINEAVSLSSYAKGYSIAVFKCACRVENIEYGDDEIDLTCNNFDIVDVIDPSNIKMINRYLNPVLDLE